MIQGISSFPVQYTVITSHSSKGNYPFTVWTLMWLQKKKTSWEIWRLAQPKYEPTVIWWISGAIEALEPRGRDKGLPCSSTVISSHAPVTRRQRQQLPGTNIDSSGQSKHYRSQTDNKEGSHTVLLLQRTREGCNKSASVHRSCSTVWPYGVSLVAGSSAAYFLLCYGTIIYSSLW